MKASSFRYLVKEGTKNVWLNRLMTIASIGVLTTCLLLIGFSFLITANINSMIQYLGDQNEVVFFIRDDATEAQVEETYDSLKMNPDLFDVVYIDKEQALEEFKASMDEEAAALLDGLEGDENPCPASFRFKIVDLSKTSTIVRQLELSPIREKINAPTDVADSMTNIRSLVNTFGSVLVAVLAVISLVIIANTIRASVFSRRREINIMKYVGATNNFIRLPFFVEGILIGLIAGGLALLLTWGGYEYLFAYISENSTTWVHQLFSNILPFRSVLIPLMIGYFGAGAVVGALGCTFSVRNHLKV